MIDDKWIVKHKDEIEKINAMAEKLRKDKRIQKIRNKFLKEQSKNNVLYKNENRKRENL